jgi:hypothetical protein
LTRYFSILFVFKILITIKKDIYKIFVTQPCTTGMFPLSYREDATWYEERCHDTGVAAATPARMFSTA